MISIIIATHNRADSLKLLLEALSEQQSCPAFEVIVADNNSSDHTRKVVDAGSKKFSGRLKYHFEARPGKCQILNQAIKLAQGSIFVFTDDDVQLEPHWLSWLIKCFETYKCDGVGGRVLPIFNADTPAWVRKNAVKLSGGVVIHDHGENDCRFEESMYPFLGANYAFRREVFDDIGGFDETLGPGVGTVGEDSEFVLRALRAGKVLYYCGRALIWHPVDPERLGWKYVSEWNIALGRYAARKEMAESNGMVLIGGVPRYLIRGIAVDAVRLGISVFSKFAFYDARRSYFRKLGMILEYRENSKLRKKRST